LQIDDYKLQRVIADFAAPVDDTRMDYRYRPEVVEALARHGLAPRGDTPPQFLRDAVNDLYRYEIRRLRQRLLRKDFPKEAYVPKVVELRDKYLLLAMPMGEWTI